MGLLSMKSNRRLLPSTNPLITFCRVQRLALAVHHAALNQVDGAIGHHFRVDPQVLVVLEQRQGGFRNTADAGLDGGAVGNQAGHVARDGAVLVGNLVLRIFGQRVRGFNESVHAADVQKRVAQRARHPVVDLHDHVPRVTAPP